MSSENECKCLKRIRVFCVKYMWVMCIISALGFGVSAILQKYLFEKKTGGVLGILDMQEFEVPYDNDKLASWFELYGHQGKMDHVIYTLAVDTFIILTFYPWMLSLLAYGGWDRVCFIAVLPMIADILENTNILYNIFSGPKTAVFMGFCTLTKFGLAIPISFLGVVVALRHKWKLRSKPNSEMVKVLNEDEN